MENMQCCTGMENTTLRHIQISIILTDVHKSKSYYYSLKKTHFAMVEPQIQRRETLISLTICLRCYDYSSQLPGMKLTLYVFSVHKQKTDIEANFK